METLCFTLRPLSAFGTPLAGDTVFGQLCWTLRHQLGNTRLNELLQGYTAGAPFAVVSDALPNRHVPLPSVPSWSWSAPADANRKSLKKKRWLPVAALSLPFDQWQLAAADDAAVLKSAQRAQPHNTINRRTGTTGEGRFAPYAMPQTWYHPDTLFDLHVVFDQDRLARADLCQALDTIGATGFGRDASIGLGKFTVLDAAQPTPWPAPAQPANSYLTLGPCAPQGLGFCPVRSHYQVTTRFGRHGDAAVQSGNPFKRPVLLARAGSVFWPDRFDPSCSHIGQGLGGVDRPLSVTMPETVQQAYAPVVAIHRPAEARR